MTFWGTYFPVLCALLTWSAFVELAQIGIYYVYSARQAKRALEIQNKLVEMQARGELPPMDVLARILGGGADEGLRNFVYPSNAPITVSGSYTPNSHGQYL